MEDTGEIIFGSDKNLAPINDQSLPEINFGIQQVDALGKNAVQVFKAVVENPSSVNAVAMIVANLKPSVAFNNMYPRMSGLYFSHSSLRISNIARQSELKINQKLDTYRNIVSTLFYEFAEKRILLPFRLQEGVSVSNSSLDLRRKYELASTDPSIMQGNIPPRVHPFLLVSNTTYYNYPKPYFADLYSTEFDQAHSLISSGSSNWNTMIVRTVNATQFVLDVYSRLRKKYPHRELWT